MTKTFWVTGPKEYLIGGQIVNTIIQYGGEPTGNSDEQPYDQTGVEFTIDDTTDLVGMVAEFEENGLYVTTPEGAVQLFDFVDRENPSP